MVSESRLTWATFVSILVFPGLSVLDLGPMYATDRQTSDRRQTKASLNAFALWGRRHNKEGRVTVLSKTEAKHVNSDPEKPERPPVHRGY